METPWRLKRTLQLAFGTAILTLLCVGAVSYRGIVASAKVDGLLSHSHEVLRGLQDLQIAVERIESNSAKYLLTGKDSYRASILTNVASARKQEARLRLLTRDNPHQRSRFPQLERLTDQKLKRVELVTEMRQVDGLSPALTAVQSGVGQRLLDEFRGVVRELREEEQRLLERREANAKHLTRQTELVLGLGTLLGVLIAAAAGWSIRRHDLGRRLAEESVRRSDDRYRLLLDGVQDHAIFALDSEGRVASWNSGAERIKGYTAEQILGRSFACFFSAEDISRDWPAEILRRTAATGRYEEEGLRVRRDGSRFLAHLSFTALRDASGLLQGFSEFSHDLTERSESEAKYRGLLEAAPDAMVVVDPTGKIVLLNRQTERLFGYLRDELVSQPITNLVSEGFADRLLADALRSEKDERAQQIGAGLELTGRRKNGSVFPIEVMLSPLASSQGILVTAAIRDISARKKAEAHLQAEAQLGQKVAELKRSNEELAQFAYIASHDLQEPLRMVASYTQLLAKRYKGKLDSDADEFIAFAVDGASRMQRLIQELLAYSRVGTSKLDSVEISTEFVLEQVLLNLSAAIQASGALVTHDPLPSVLGDETQLIQLFQNLVGNGIKYHGAEAPQIHLSAAKNGQNSWTFSVKDNGLGIDPQYFERIFGMFQRLHTREEFAGTGIGLAICKRIVERHGGKIWVESQRGEGSTFRFALAESLGTT